MYIPSLARQWRATRQEQWGCKLGDGQSLRKLASAAGHLHVALEGGGGGREIRERGDSSLARHWRATRQMAGGGGGRSERGETVA